MPQNMEDDFWDIWTDEEMGMYEDEVLKGLGYYDQYGWYRSYSEEK